MAKVCVFTASSPPETPEIEAALIRFGQNLARGKHHLITGGASSGGMAVVNKSYLDAGGHHAHIIYPEEYASYEEAFRHPNLTHLRVKNLHIRLETMLEDSECFAALPGAGLGTLHEILQVWADNQAALYHKGVKRCLKPQVLYNPPYKGQSGYFDKLLAQVIDVAAGPCIREEQIARLIKWNDNIDLVLPMLMGMLKLEQLAAAA